MDYRQIISPFGAVDEQGLIKACQDLLQTPSYTGQEREAAELLMQIMLDLGYDRAWIDGVGNVIGEIRGGKPGRKILFDGHIDTSPVSGSEVWTRDPFDGVIENGRIYGRGAVGMKGAIAAMVYGLAPLVKHKDKLAGSVFISGSVGKEQFEGLAFCQVIQVVKPDYVIIGEASGLNIKHGQRGRAEIVITTAGKAAHSAYPMTGKNAGYMMMSLVQELVKQPMPQSDYLGQGSMEMTNIISAPYPATSTVPHKCWTTFDRYLVADETAEEIIANISEFISLLQQEDDEFKAEVAIVESGLECYTGQYLHAKRLFPAWVLSPEHKLVSDSLSALRLAGLKPELSTYSISTNGSYSAGVAKLPTIGFGPGCESDVHVVDENIELTELFAAAAGYQAIAGKFLLNK